MQSLQTCRAGTYLILLIYTFLKEAKLRMCLFVAIVQVPACPLQDYSSWREMPQVVPNLGGHDDSSTMTVMDHFW